MFEFQTEAQKAAFGKLVANYNLKRKLSYSVVDRSDGSSSLLVLFVLSYESFHEPM